MPSDWHCSISRTASSALLVEIAADSLGPTPSTCSNWSPGARSTFPGVPNRAISRSYVRGPMPVTRFKRTVSIRLCASFVASELGPGLTSMGATRLGEDARLDLRSYPADALKTS